MNTEKAGRRAAVRAMRAAADLRTEDPRRLAHLLDWLPDEASVAAVYASTPSEPGTGELVDALVARGWRVLLPVLRREPDWAWFEGWDAMRPGWHSIPEPTSARLGAGALAEAALVVVSCLGVDPEGYRLGVGGGWYDRALLHRGEDATVLAWARADEVVDRVPREAFDLPVDGFVTEDGLTWARAMGVH